METDLLESNQCDESKSDLFVILSVSSWIILIITSWIPILSLGINKSEKIKNLWLFYKIKENTLRIRDIKINYYNLLNNVLDINFVVFNIIFISTFIITTLGFLIYIYSLYIKKEKVVKGMLGPYSKFHFIPILFISALFLIGETYHNSNEENQYDVYLKSNYSFPSFNNAQYIFSLVFTFLSIISLIFISLKTKITSPWYATLTINKGAFSCFFALLIYNFGYVLSEYIINKKDYKIPEQFDEQSNLIKKCILSFVIIIGILNNTASVLLQDYMIALINFLIYLGMTITFYKRDEESRNKFKLYKSIGILDIIMMSLSFLCILFHIIRFKGIIPN